MSECYFGGKSDVEIQQIIDSTITELKAEDAGFEDVIGLEALKEQLSKSSGWLYCKSFGGGGGRRSIYTMLLFGPHGVGKTMVIKALAKKTDATFFDVPSSQLFSDYPGGCIQLVNKLMETAQRLSPSIIFIRDAELLFLESSRSDFDLGHGAGYQLRQYFDGHKTAGDENILVICETDKPYDIDDRYIGHFTDRFFVPLPDDDSRKQIFLSEMKNDWQWISDDEIGLLTSMTKGYSFQDIKNVVKTAKSNLRMKRMEATHFVRITEEYTKIPSKYIGKIIPCEKDQPGSFQACVDGLATDEVVLPPITFDCLKKAIQECQKSVSWDELEKHEDFNERYGCRYLLRFNVVEKKEEKKSSCVIC